MNTKKMIRENCASADNSGINSLTLQEQQVIEKLTKEFRKKIVVPCTSCSYCMPCPHGVNIPQNFACLNNVTLERSRFRRIMTRRSYRQLQNSKAKVNNSNPNGNATLCIKCGVCATKCPQKIRIPEELEKVKHELGKRKAILG